MKKQAANPKKNDELFKQIVNSYRKQRAFDGARLVLWQWRLSRKLNGGK